MFENVIFCLKYQNMNNKIFFLYATLCLFFTQNSVAQQPIFDLLIRNGKIIDGSGNPWFRADIGILNGKIAAIGRYDSTQAKRTIDASGMVVAPGFIDVHTHSESGIFRVPTADNFILDGVTSIITGNCGGSEDNLTDFFRKITKNGASVNVGSFIGHNNIRRQVMKKAMRDPTPQEHIEMEKGVEKAMKQGAVGLSTGLIYIPGTYAKTPEIVGLAKVAARFGGVYTAHIRNEGEKVSDAISEAITVGREARIPVEISHFKVSFKPLWGKSTETVALVEKARQEGIDINIDQYPYTASSTNMGTLLPSWVLADSDSAMKVRLRDPSVKTKIKAEMIASLMRDERKNWDYAVVARSVGDSTINGKTISDINILRGRQPTTEDEAETIFDLMATGGGQMIYHKMSETDIDIILKYPNTMIASDGGVEVYGFGVTHPRSYGTNARVLGRYVRERKTLTLEDAIRRMTSLPAQRFRMDDRGLLRVGYAADVVIFDEKTVADKATYERPHAYSVGFQWVIVNGKLTVVNGQHTGEKAGQIILGKGFVP
jgi:N-acyl-D-amino-acid deacylase